MKSNEACWQSLRTRTTRYWVAGALALHVDAGDSVAVVIACEGESLRYGAGAVNQSEHILESAKVLGIEEVLPLSFADQRLDTLSLVD